MGPDPAGLAARLAAADLRQAHTEHGRLGDDLDRTEAAARAPATNWLPTPSAAYYQSIYKGDPDAKQPMPTNNIRVLIRTYYPAPGSNTQASILPPPNGSMGATYVFPAIKQPQTPGHAAAKLTHVPATCVRVLLPEVEGRMISSVSWSLDGTPMHGHTVRPSREYATSIALTPGSHHLAAIVAFEASSHTSPRTIRRTVSGCPPAPPLFTG